MTADEVTDTYILALAANHQWAVTHQRRWAHGMTSARLYHQPTRRVIDTWFVDNRFDRAYLTTPTDRTLTPGLNTGDPGVVTGWLTALNLCDAETVA